MRGYGPTNDTLAALGARLAKRGMLAAMLAAAVLAGCVPRAQSHLERGEILATGAERYDAFLRSVLDLRAEAAKLAEDEASARTDLARALGAPAGAEASVVAGAAESKARALEERGVLLHLELTPEPKVVRARKRSGAPTGPDGNAGDESLARVESSVRAAVTVARRCEKVARRAGEMEEEHARLEAELPEALRDQPASKRREVSTELVAARSALREAASGSRRSAGAIALLVLDIAGSLETGARLAAPSPPPPGPAAPGAPAKPRWSSKGATRPAAASAAPAAPPAQPTRARPAPKRGAADDFDP